MSVMEIKSVLCVREDFIGKGNLHKLQVLFAGFMLQSTKHRNTDLPSGCLTLQLTLFRGLVQTILEMIMSL